MVSKPLQLNTLVAFGELVDGGQTQRQKPVVNNRYTCTLVLSMCFCNDRNVNLLVHDSLCVGLGYSKSKRN